MNLLKKKKKTQKIKENVIYHLTHNIMDIAITGFIWKMLKTDDLILNISLYSKNWQSSS